MIELVSIRFPGLAPRAWVTGTSPRLNCHLVATGAQSRLVTYPRSLRFHQCVLDHGRLGADCRALLANRDVLLAPGAKNPAAAVSLFPPLPDTGIADCGRRWPLGKPSVGQPSPSSIHALIPPSGGRDAIVACRLGGASRSLQGTIMVIPRVVVPTNGSVVSERCGSKLKCRYAGPCVRRGICLRAKSEWQALIGNCFHAAWPLRIAAPSKSGPSYSLGARARAALNRLGQHTHECPRRFRSRPTISLGGFDVV